LGPVWTGAESIVSTEIRSPDRPASKSVARLSRCPVNHLLFQFIDHSINRKTCKDGARPTLFLIFVLFYVFFVLLYVLLCCSMYCLFCVVLCIACVYMCTELLPPGGYPIAVKYIIYHNLTYTDIRESWDTCPNLR
jgi:hypothetical protein